MRRAMMLIWGGTLLPFVLTVINGGPDGWLPHLAFHPLYVAFLGLGLWGARLVRTAGTTRAVRGLALTLMVVVGAATAGHLGEFVAVLRHGGLAADESVFEAPLHVWSATVTLPAVMLSIVLAGAVTVAAAAARSGRPGATLNRWVRTVHRLSSIGFVVAAPAAIAFSDVQVVGFVAIAALVVLLLTGLQMSVRHYSGRWRRRRHAAVAPSPTAEREGVLSDLLT